MCCALRCGITSAGPGLLCETSSCHCCCLVAVVLWLCSNVWQHLSESGSDEAEVEEAAAANPPAALPCGRLSRQSAAVIKLLGAPVAQLQCWQSLEDVLADADDQTGAVDTAMAQHFDDIMLTDHPLAWWGTDGLELLLKAVQRRVQQYPGGQFTVEADLQTLQQQKRLHLQQADGGEHAVAVAAALQLRVCEQQILLQLQKAAQQILYCDM